MSTEEILARGPVCECDDPRCLLPLGICWGEYEVAHKGVLLYAASCQTRKEPVCRYVDIGMMITMEIAWSECAMSMEVAGKIMQVSLLHSDAHGRVAQLFKDGREFSAPILVGEAGIYREGEDSYYYYLPTRTLGGAK